MTVLQPTAVAAVLLLSASACGSTNTPGTAPSHPVTTASSSAAAVVTVVTVATVATVANYLFSPLTVAPGATITAVDGDDEPHTVTFDDGSFTTVTFDKTHPVTFTAPSKPGTYAIHCKVHPSMHGTIVVRQP